MGRGEVMRRGGRGLQRGGVLYQRSNNLLYALGVPRLRAKRREKGEGKGSNGEKGVMKRGIRGAVDEGERAHVQAARGGRRKGAMGRGEVMRRGCSAAASPTSTTSPMLLAHRACVQRGGKGGTRRRRRRGGWVHALWAGLCGWVGPACVYAECKGNGMDSIRCELEREEKK